MARDNRMLQDAAKPHRWFQALSRNPASAN
jgi:hypothetical protein